MRNRPRATTRWRSTPTSTAPPGFGLPGVTVDGTDFFAVYEAAGEIIKRAREGGGPALLECKMIRFFGHFEGDQQTYRGKGEVEDIRANQDCIKMFAGRRSSRPASITPRRARRDRQGGAGADRGGGARTRRRRRCRPPADLMTDVYVAY